MWSCTIAPSASWVLFLMVLAPRSEDKCCVFYILFKYETMKIFVET